MAAQERAQAENLTADVETNPARGQEGGVQDQPIISDEIGEVLQEKTKKSRRLKKPPKVLVSNGIIPSSGAGTSASGTALEQGEESLSEKQKKKRSRRSLSVGRVQSPVRAVLTDRISESVIDDSKTAAWFANIQSHGHEGPLPAALVSDPDSKCLKLLLSHSSAFRRCKQSVESELQAYQRKCVEAEERAIEESAKASTLQRQLADEKTGIASKIRRATKAAMQTFATKFQGKIDRAKEKIKALAKAEAWLPNVAGGDVEFDSLFAGLDSDLVISPISSDSSGTTRDNVSLETLAVDVGVRAFDGSMTGELGVNYDDGVYVNIDD
ncbi:hypothetical protein AALP_AA8G209900 [Arabis alpina]|uniref:Uncharacterized protein n=1 Tax=Arabis alpina TaxID=50452 RepID=A0A087G8E5_ARAAL|nr:hypothetical protein AALP_AA8G209900 [Arabis alpina]